MSVSEQKVRFWGKALSVRPRLIVTWVDDERSVTCPGYIAAIGGTLDGVAVPFTVAIGPATYEKRPFQTGALVRGEALRVPEGGLPDVPADLYRVTVLRLIAPGPEASPDPPRTDAPLSADAVPTAPRRALAPQNVRTGGPCRACPHAVLACVVRLTDPRQPPRSGKWTRLPACLGPEDCPHFAPPPSE
jgi:hypothetical protein